MTEDPGKHYRFEYKVCLTEQDKKNEHVIVKLDPFRIAQIYGMTSFALMTVLKKCLCTGNRGHKDKKQDLLDIISAANRELEILKEDGTDKDLTVTKIPNNTNNDWIKTEYRLPSLGQTVDIKTEKEIYRGTIDKRKFVWVLTAACGSKSIPFTEGTRWRPLK